MSSADKVTTKPFEEFKEDIKVQPVCKGDWLLGTSCGNCPRCIKYAMKLLPAAIKYSREVSSVLEAIEKELRAHGKLVSNPKLVSIAIKAVLDSGEVDVEKLNSMLISSS